MNAFLLVLPLFLIRFGLMGLLNRGALGRAAFFAPLEGGERAAYLLYQVTNAILLLYPIFLQVRTSPPWVWAGLVSYLLGIALLTAAAAAFARPDPNGLNTGGIYQFSRNPMYVGYFFYFLGCALLTRSTLLVLSLMIFQLSSHWIILSEERWCIRRFGSEYTLYMKRVRRYL